MQDSISVLSHATLPLAKTWKADGTILPYGDGKYFTYKKVEIAKIKIEPKVEIAKIEPLRREISKPSSHTMVSEKSKTNIITSRSKDDDEWESF